MKTIHIGREEVDAYARDLAGRLAALGDDCPTVWCPIGKSGDHLVRRVAVHMPDPSAFTVVEVSFNKTDRTASFTKPGGPAAIEGRNVLVLDSSVHSGNSMLACMRLVQQAGAKYALSYALVTKRSATFVPHWFGVVVGDHDRSLFMLDQLPNNRLFTSRYKPMGLLRKIAEEDANRPGALETGVDSIDKISWGDLFYEHRANGYQVYLVEDGPNIAGFLKVKVRESHALAIDVVAADRRYQRRGIGGAMMRFAETLGRSSQCRYIDLWALQDKVPTYEHLGYANGGETIDAGAGERYTYMQKELLYHFSLAEDEHP